MDPLSLHLPQGTVTHAVDADAMNGLSFCDAIEDSLAPILLPGATESEDHKSLRS